MEAVQWKSLLSRIFKDRLVICPILSRILLISTCYLCIIIKSTLFPSQRCSSLNNELNGHLFKKVSSFTWEKWPFALSTSCLDYDTPAAILDYEMALRVDTCPKILEQKIERDWTNEDDESTILVLNHLHVFYVREIKSLSYLSLLFGFPIIPRRT